MMKKKWNPFLFAFFVLFCILLDFGGRKLSTHLQLPLWLDSFGTVLCAYLAGPVCGSIAGMTANLISGMENRLSAIYALTSLTTGVIVGLSARKNRLETFSGAMSTSFQTAFTAIAVSVPLNILFYEGSTGNVWGDGVISYMKGMGVPTVLSEIIGQTYVDFGDKIVTLVALFLALRLIGFIRKKRGGAGMGGSSAAASPAVKTLALLAALGIGLTAALPARGAQEASSAGVRDYNDYVQTVFSSKNGLPCGEANDIAQTNDGILWVGTYAGLYRYNGREFRWMDGYDSVRNVNCLYVDEEGRLWIGTNDNGLSIAINEQIVNVVDQSRGLPSNSVRCIIQSSDGYYYVGTTGSMQILSLNSGLKVINNLSEINYADHIAASEKGFVAAVTSNGRLFLLRGGQILSSRQLTGGGEIFKSCRFDSAGRLLAGTTSGRIIVFNVSSGGFEKIGSISCTGLTSLKDLYFLDSGELFVTADNGVGYVDAQETFHLVNTNNFNNSIDTMLADYQGNLWFTSSRLGLLRMAPSAFRDVYSTVGMSSRVVNTITRWQGVYYFGTDKGLDAVNAECRARVEHQWTEKLRGVRIRCMTVDTEDSLWVCTYGSGLLEIEKDGTEHLYNSFNGSFGDRARLVTQLRDGTVLAAGDTGISFIRDHQIQRTIRYSNGLINSMILTAIETPDGAILAGTDGDGIAVIRDGKVEKMLRRQDGLSSEVILRLVPDPKGKGAFIVTSNGLGFMDWAGAIRSLDVFPYYNNYNIWVRDPDTLFVMSSAGVFIVSRDELLSSEKELRYELLASRQGLNSSITANSWTFSDESGRLFLPCDKGVFIVSAGSYGSVAHSYRMSISSLRLDNQQAPIERSSAITVDRDVNKIEISPEILNYTIQDPYVGYRLDGFDDHWTIQPQSAMNTIVYTNLAPGKYTFRLAVFDSSRQNIVSERSYDLIKPKEINDSRWFIFYLVLVPMLAVAWLTWFAVTTQVRRKMEMKNRELAVAKKQALMGEQTIMAIANAVDAKDVRTSQHSQRVSHYSVMIAKELGFSDAECENLRKTALMHDIGKIGIPDAILNKPSRLTDEEYAIMKSHTLRGAEILKDFTLIDHVVEGALHHHERYDGKGYPNRMMGEEIPIYARIIGVADAFDAMTANRVYRKQMDFEYVFNEMRKGRGTQFDPQIVDILLKLIDDGKINLKQLYAPQAEEA